MGCDLGPGQLRLGAGGSDNLGLIWNTPRAWTRRFHVTKDWCPGRPRTLAAHGAGGRLVSRSGLQTKARARPLSAGAGSRSGTQAACTASRRLCISGGSPEPDLPPPGRKRRHRPDNSQCAPGRGAAGTPGRSGGLRRGLPRSACARTARAGGPSQHTCALSRDLCARELCHTRVCIAASLAVARASGGGRRPLRPTAPAQRAEGMHQ